MSKQANPFAIGAFLIGALLLLSFGLMIFGGGDLLKHKKRFVIFFDSTLNGLNIGAPVKLQGVQIGNVTEISLEMDKTTEHIYKPVVIEIEPDLLREFTGRDHDGAETTPAEDAKKLIALGLKARIETQSLLTGLLYVDLNFYHDKPTKLVDFDYKSLPELPSVPATVDEIRNIADEIINKVRQLPLESMVTDLSTTLKETSSLLKSDETKTSMLAMSKTLQETQKLLAELNKQIGPLLNNANGTLSETRADIRDFDRQITPVLKAAEQSLTAAAKVLEDSKKTLKSVDNFAAADSPLGQALLEMRDAARSIKDLSDSLERHPDAIIYGK